MTDVQWIPNGYVRLAVVNDVNLYSDDVRTLQKGQWLNDNVITFLLELIYNHLEPSKQEQIHIVHASICEILKYQQDDSDLPSFFEPADLHLKNNILFVLNDNLQADKFLAGSHWALLHFDRGRNEFIYLDSLAVLNPGTLSVAQHIRELFVQNDFLKTESKPQLVAGRCAKQSNGSDCGLFVVEFGKMGGYNENTLKKSIPEDMTKNRVCWLNKARLLYERTNT